MNQFYANNANLFSMIGGIFSLLAVATLITFGINVFGGDRSSALVENLNARMKAWWVMITLFSVAITAGGITSILLFACVSFAALREFITLTPARETDYRTLIYAFFVILPVNYLLIALHSYDLFVVFVPVCAFVIIPVRSALAGDSKDFLARSATIQWALLLCVYFISYAPALLSLTVPGFEFQMAGTLCFLMFVVQVSDVMQYVFGKIFGKHKIAPSISPNKTVEGFIGGVVSAVVLGTCFWWVTPFQPWQAACMALVICLAGFGGGIVMSAIKRDRGVKDFSSLIPGHGGMIDRVDSLCFAAPVFFHLTRHFFGC